MLEQKIGQRKPVQQIKIFLPFYSHSGRYSTRRSTLFLEVWHPQTANLTPFVRVSTVRNFLVWTALGQGKLCLVSCQNTGDQREEVVLKAEGPGSTEDCCWVSAYCRHRCCIQVI